MSAPLTAKEMAALEKARQNVKKETYKAILEQFSRKIRTSHELWLKEALLTVPRSSWDTHGTTYPRRSSTCVASFRNSDTRWP